MDTPWILHVDVDAFFASVEQVLRPELRGRPVVVGGGTGGRGVVASASYEARRFGLKAGMPIHRARELCPEAVYLSGSFERYNRFSERVFELLCGVSPSVEQASLDEAYLSLRGCRRLYGAWAGRPTARVPFLEGPDGVYCRSEGRPVPVSRRTLVPESWRWMAAVAMGLKNRMLAQTGLSVSVGVGTNKLVAKVASDFRKPQGLTIVTPGREADFLAGLELRDLPGIGPATWRKFHKWNVRTVREARRLPADLLEDAFGPHRGRAIHRLLRGDGPVEPESPDRPQSISRETTFWRARANYEVVEAMLFDLTERLGRALRREKLEGGTAHLKLRYQNRAAVQRSRSLGTYTDRDDRIFGTARAMLRSGWRRSRRVRLVGVGITDLRPARLFQPSLFDDGAERYRRLDRCLDGLRERFGSEAVRRGPAINLPGALDEPRESACAIR